MLAIIFDGVGAGEWLVLLAVLLVVVGPQRLPEMARNIGRWYNKFRRAAESFKRQLMEMDTEFQSVVDDVDAQMRSSVDDVKKEFVDADIDVYSDNDDVPAVYDEMAGGYTDEETGSPEDSPQESSVEGEVAAGETAKETEDGDKPVEKS